MNTTIWDKKIEMPSFPSLSEDTSTDVLIVGGGIAGILCARELQERNIDYILIEKDRILQGVTLGTTAKITVGHGLIYDKLIRQFDGNTARLYYDAQRAATERYKTLAKEIPCDFEIADNYIYATDTEREIEKELYALQCIGRNAEFADKLPLPIPTKGAVRYRAQAQFHPLKFFGSLAKDLRIYEHTAAHTILNNTVFTENSKIRAKKIVVATHFPIVNKHGGYFLKMYQHRSYVLALENALPLKDMYRDADTDGLSFRSYGNILLLGGGSHRTGKKGGGWAPLRSFAQKHYIGAKEICHFATQDCMTLDGVPYIGAYSKNTPDLLVATGFNKWGMTSAMAASSLLADLIEEKENPYTALFSPARFMLRKQFWINMGESVSHLLRPTSPRCPHLGCALQWNPKEHSWDCACHGSRFNQNGTLLDGPATKDMKKDL